MVRGKKTFIIICVLAFFTFFAQALTLYIQSSYLQLMVGIQYAGLFITLATIINLFAIYAFPQFIKQFSNYWVMVAVTVMYIFGTFFLMISNHILTQILFYVIHFVAIILIGINLDIFLEDISAKKRTGLIRTTYLTVVSAAILLGPLTAGQLIGNSENYYLAFFASAFMAMTVLGILIIAHKSLSDHITYNRRNIIELFNIIKNNRNMLHVFIVSFVLRLFYCIMVVYMPLYLHHTLRFSWSTIGIIFPIILLPFVLLELPAGKLADKYIGEKELMILGMIIMAISTGSIFYVNSKSAILWTLVLFITRVGAALNESMQEVYFFKIVKREDVDIINLFRDMTPAGWLVGSLMSVIILKFFNMLYVFLFLAIIIALSLISAFKLKDTK